MAIVKLKVEIEEGVADNRNASGKKPEGSGGGGKCISIKLYIATAIRGKS